MVHPSEPISSAADEVRRWRRRPVLAALIRLAGFVVPFCVASLAVAVVGALYGPPAGAFGSGASLLRVAVLLGVGVGAAILAERLVRPLFPLASLLQMSLLFPDRAPSRALTALRAGATRDAKDLLEDPDAAVDEREAASRILVLVSALGRHDRITRGHCERVRTYADLMATHLGLSAHDADRLRWAALLHDIGKLRVAYATLNKKGKLDAEEWEAIKRHPSEGAALIAPMAGWLGSWADAVPQHHERIDGRGYPSGLAGEDIHPGARIIAIVDAFDVMTASRSYKRPISSAAARAELKRCAGSQFDPALVEAFLELPAHRTGWWAGALAALLQVPGVTHLARVPSTIAGATAQLPAAASATLSTVAVGATSLALVAGVATAAAPPTAAGSTVSGVVAHAAPTDPPPIVPTVPVGTSPGEPASSVPGQSTSDSVDPASDAGTADPKPADGADEKTSAVPTSTTTPDSSGESGNGNGNGNGGKGNGKGNNGNGKGNGGPSDD